MENKRKKGFTLIELLAVIVILAIIVLIALPRILNVVEKSRMSAFKSSASLMAKAATLKYTTDNVNNSENYPLIYTFTDKNNDNYLPIQNGSEPDNGEIKVNENGKVSMAIVSRDKKYCATKNYLDISINVRKVSSLGQEGCASDDATASVKVKEALIEDKKTCDLEEETIDGTKYYYVDSVSDLYQLSKNVNSGTSYLGTIVKLRNNLDMSKPDSTCGREKFSPIGEKYEKPFAGTFDGNAKAISNLTINEPEKEDVGLFGYNTGTIKGLKITKANVIGNKNVGILIGTNNKGNVYDTMINGTVSGNQCIAAVNGEGTDGYLSSIIVDANISGSSDVYGGSGCAGFGPKKRSILLLSGKVNGNANAEIYTENVSISGSKRDEGLINVGNSKDVLNAYEQYIDTIIGGDNNGSGYYFDYDVNGNISIIKSKNDNLTGEGTEESPYLIKSYNDWKIATQKVNNNTKYIFSLENDIDFSGKHFYMLGSFQNKFYGKLNGNGHALKGIKINSGNYQGIVGYLESGATITNLVVDGFTITNGNNYTGSISGDNRGNILGITLKNININGHDYVGGVTGNDERGTISNISLSGKVNGNKYVTGINGKGRNGKILNVILNVDVTGKEYTYAGYGYDSFWYSRNNIILESGNISGTLNVNAYSKANVTVGNASGATEISDADIHNLEYYNSKFSIPIKNTVSQGNFYFDKDSSGNIVVKLK